jgi:hypothetical protein
MSLALAFSIHNKQQSTSNASTSKWIQIYYKTNALGDCTLIVQIPWHSYVSCEQFMLRSVCTRDSVLYVQIVTDVHCTVTHGTVRVLHVQLYSCTVGQSGLTMVRLRCTNVSTGCTGEADSRRKTNPDLCVKCIRWQDWAYRRIREGRRIRSWIREGRRIRSL